MAACITYNCVFGRCMVRQLQMRRAEGRAARSLTGRLEAICFSGYSLHGYSLHSERRQLDPPELLFLAEGGAGAKQKMNPETSPGPWSDSPDTSNPPSLLATFGKAQFCRGSAPLGGSLPQAPYASRQPRRVVRPHNAIVAKGCTPRQPQGSHHGARQPLCASAR